MKKYQVVIIGGGSGGMAAAVELKKNGIDDIVVLEKDMEAGGILQQCIHNGFGLQTFHEQLSGPQYAQRYIRMCEEYHVDMKFDTTVISFTEDKKVTYVNPQEGYVTVEAEAIIFAVGCYERPRGAINISGSRCSGIYTAGQAQRYLNMNGYLVGKKVFILGSGDIGLIMARRMKLEGADVLGVAEIMPYSNGLERNIKQCLQDFNIPLFLSHTVTKVFGQERLERIELCEVDEKRNPIVGTEQYFDVDTLLLSVGLIPENSLMTHAGIGLDRATSGPVVDENYMVQDGIFACGNGLHVHDLVDFVCLQALRCADGVIAYLNQKESKENIIDMHAGNQVGYIVPQKIHEDVDHAVEFFFRVKTPMDDATLNIISDGQVIRTMHKQKWIPSEMERVLLTPEQLHKAKDNITFEVEVG